MTPGPPAPQDPLHADHDLLVVLERARQLGFLGPGPVADQVRHARTFLAAVPAAPGHAVDLGSGGGLPGLVLARAWPTSRWWLVESSVRRATFLSQATRDLVLEDRVEVLAERAEVLGADPVRRGRADLVVSRSFGSPPVTAELGAPFLRVGGVLAVSEPPDPRSSRWSGIEDAPLGLVRSGLVEAEGAHLQLLTQATPCPSTAPRATRRIERSPGF